MAATPAFELPFKYPNATWKRALGSRHAKPDRDLPGDQQQLHLIDSFMISRHVLSCRDAAYPEKKTRMVSIVWNSGAGGAFLEPRSLACGASHCCVEAVGGVQVAVVAGRGCGLPWGVRSLSYRAEISRASPTAIVMVMD